MDNIGNASQQRWPITSNRKMGWPTRHNVVVFVGASSKPSCDRLSIRLYHNNVTVVGQCIHEWSDTIQLGLTTIQLGYYKPKYKLLNNEHTYSDRSTFSQVLQQIYFLRNPCRSALPDISFVGRWAILLWIKAAMNVCIHYMTVLSWKFSH